MDVRGEVRASISNSAAAAPTPLLGVRALSAAYGPVLALDRVDVTLQGGELVVLTGEPGAGKSTLVRCLAGDVTPVSGEILLEGQPVPAGSAAAERLGIGVVWQDLELCDNLDVAGNLLLGQETGGLMLSRTRFHARARQMLAELAIPIRDTTQHLSKLPRGQRQLLAVTKVMSRGSRLLVLDEPTAAVGATETQQVEQLIGRARDEGRAVLVATQDIDQMLRIADRIIVLREGRVVAELDPATTHPDEIAALLSGQRVDSSARRQLTRLHALADRLVSADPSSSLSLILSALGTALGAEKVSIHVVSEGTLVRAASLGFDPAQLQGWSRLPIGPDGGPPGRAAAHEERVIVEDLHPGDGWQSLGSAGDWEGIGSSWSVPVLGPDGISAVITVFQGQPGPPGRDEIDLLSLYAGWAAGAVEREQLLAQATARNRVLETIREMLETLAGAGGIDRALTAALRSLRRGLQADEVALLVGTEKGQSTWRAYVGLDGQDAERASATVCEVAERGLVLPAHDGTAREFAQGGAAGALAVPFMAPGSPAVLVAVWQALQVTEGERALIEDAAHSLRLALEREESALAHQEAAALRRSRELQRGFLSRLSHELRTPLTAIRGYASSLMQPDVTWDGDSEQRFLDRIAAESARLGRLVDDLLDFSAIESGVMRLQLDWCDVPLVIDAAVSCLPPHWSDSVSVAGEPALPPVWADHDRLEQVFVNLLSNALRHNPAGTRVEVRTGVRSSRAAGPDGNPREVEITVSDDGAGFPKQLTSTPFEPARRHRSRSAGAGLGLSITRGIVEAHGGRIELVPAPVGTSFRIHLPVEGSARPITGDPGEAVLSLTEEPEARPEELHAVGDV
jgi:signal transduction histidine kinase/ABC-type multidrug transport system ATPase subunit